MGIWLDYVHYKIAYRYEVNTGSRYLSPSGLSFDEGISAYYENVRSYPPFLSF